MQLEFYKAKSLIRTAKPSLFSWATVYLNPFQGCYHDCQYCDGKAENYHMHKDFSNTIRIKQNSPQLLEKFLEKKGLLPINRKKLKQKRFFMDPQTAPQASFELFIGGGVCDVYQPAEEEVQLTRKLLQIAYEYNVPVQILTKSDLVLRDLDLLQKINQSTHAAVNFTITVAEDSVQHIFEPRASKSSERFQAIQILRESGISSGIYAYPLLPFIGDQKQNLQTIFAKAKESQVEFITVSGLTLKPGKNKQEFMNTLQRHFPELIPKYKRLYGNNDKYGTLDWQVAQNLSLKSPMYITFPFHYQYNIPYVIPRYIPPGKKKFSINLKCVEFLMRLYYLQTSVLNRYNTRSSKIYRTAMKLDSYPKKISPVLLKTSSYQREIFIPVFIKRYLLDFLQNPKKNILTTLESQIYKNIS